MEEGGYPHAVIYPASAILAEITAVRLGTKDVTNVPAFKFTEKSIRRGFLRKVYAILMCQMLVTVGFIAIFIFSGPMKMWVHDNPRVLLVAFGVLVTSMIFLVCSEALRRKFPLNFIFLAIFTIAMSFLLGFMASLDPFLVTIAVGMTTVVCFALTMFALQTKWDFTACGGALLCALVILLTAGFCAAFVPDVKLSKILYSSLGVLVYSFLLIYDTQLMLGGEHKYSISPEEYLFAALTIYLDIINMLMFILRLLR